MSNLSKILTILAIVGIGVIVYGKYKNISKENKAKLKTKE